MLGEEVHEGAGDGEGPPTSGRLGRTKNDPALAVLGDLLGYRQSAAQEVEAPDAQPGHLPPPQPEDCSDVHHRPVLRSEGVSQGGQLLAGDDAPHDMGGARQLDAPARRAGDEVAQDRVLADGVEGAVLAANRIRRRPAPAPVVDERLNIGGRERPDRATTEGWTRCLRTPSSRRLGPGRFAGFASSHLAATSAKVVDALRGSIHPPRARSAFSVASNVSAAFLVGNVREICTPAGVRSITS